MEDSKKMTTEGLKDLYYYRLKKERHDTAIELEKTIHLESDNKLRTKIFEHGHANGYTAVVFIIDEKGYTLLVVHSIEYWNSLKRFVTLMTTPSDADIDTLQSWAESEAIKVMTSEE